MRLQLPLYVLPATPVRAAQLHCQMPSHLEICSVLHPRPPSEAEYSRPGTPTPTLGPLLVLDGNPADYCIRVHAPAPDPTRRWLWSRVLSTACLLLLACISDRLVCPRRSTLPDSRAPELATASCVDSSSCPDCQPGQPGQTRAQK
ncbi:hypothetical protein BD289DRAFT_79539 [Coniella lustricola]|uniref:Uncharacterized protein n=1 Tax=Coniella lustricola TaxID=2025994 RepID=A0A2T2ZZ30_9PEZI|nr:hypothetical protein BD289DRAFT_79539 [Coniella lustricola]